MSRGSPYVQPAFVLLGLAAAGMPGCNPMTAWTNNQSGKILYQQGRYAEASGEFRRAAIDAPRNPDYLHNYATASRRAGRWTVAEQAYRGALALDPAHQPSYHGLAVTFKETGRFGEAHSLLANWSASQPYSPKPLIEMAWLQQEMGDYTGAERSLNQALAVRPGHPLALANLGQVYQKTGRTQMARTAYQKSLATDWNQPRLASRLARLGGTSRTLPAPTTIASVPGRYNPISVVTAPAGTAPAANSPQPVPASGRQPAPGPIATPTPRQDGKDRQSSAGSQQPTQPFASTPAGHFPGKPFQPSSGQPMARQPFRPTGGRSGMPLAREPFQPSGGNPLARRPFTNNERAYMDMGRMPATGTIRQSSGEYPATTVPRR